MVSDKQINSECGQDSALDLSERAMHLFRTLVESYIECGQAVSSRALVRSSGLGLSSATVRNVMADLEEMGLILSPHTSAGRVPTVKGYRFFVNYLMKISGAQSEHATRIASALSKEADTRSLLVRTSGLLSQITHMAGIVMVPRTSNEVRQVEFIPISGNQVLMILVRHDHDVQNRIIRLPYPMQASWLQEVSNAINAHLAKQPNLAAARDGLLRELRSEYREIRELMGLVVSFAEGRQVTANGDYFMAGETNLVAADGLADMSQLRTLFDSFNRKHEILELLDRAINARGVQIFIGEESGYDALKDCSVVASSYERDGEAVGVVGVIGPTRMRYNDVVPVVDLAAQTLGDALSTH